jgi:phage FluMu gp28-like protein
MIHFTLNNPYTTSLIVAPGLRQSMIVMDRIQELVSKISSQRRRERFKRIKRTTISLKNGSMLVALPCAVNLLRGYTVNLLVVDEGSFIRDDETVFYSVLFPMLQTTNGTLIVSSTPWSKDCVFYKFTQDPTFKVHRITIDTVIKAGLATREFIQEMQRRTPAERYRREYLAEFVDDELSYFQQKLIVQCIDSSLSPLTDDWTRNVKAQPGRYFLGVDFGKHNDYSVVAIVQLDKEGIVKLIGIVRFPLETPYANVIGYVKIICDKLNSVEKTLCDQTGVGEYIVEDMKQARIRSTIEGINLTLPSKQEILGYMKQLMQTNHLSLYYDADLNAEINVETFEATKTGQIQFSHPEGTHDDQLWALALAIYATRTPDTSFMRVLYGVPKNY